MPTTAPPPFVPINIAQVRQQALQGDIQGYGASDADYNARFPNLVRGRDFNIGDATSQLAGAPDPLVTSTLNKSGLRSDFGNNHYTQARNSGVDILSKEKRSRNYFSTLLAHNPQRQFGVESSADLMKMIYANTGNLTSYNQANYASRVNEYNSSLLQSARNQESYAGAASSLIGSIGRLYNNNYQQPSSLDRAYYRENWGYQPAG